MKNRGYVIVLALLLVIITSVWFSTFEAVTSNKNSQFEVQTVERELSNIYIYNYLQTYDKNKITPEDISEAEIDEYRYRFGNLDSQVLDITNQYKGSIQQAENEKSPQKAQALMHERDEKITAILDNFRDEDKVRKKIVKEYNEEVLDNREVLLKDYKPLVKSIKEKYWYYLIDANGNVYKNREFAKINLSESNIYEQLKKESPAKPLKIEVAIQGPDQMIHAWNAFPAGHSLRGVVAIAKGSDLEKQYLAEAKAIKNQRLCFSASWLLIIIVSVIFYFYLKEQVSPDSFILTVLKKIPLDSRTILLLALTALYLYLTKWWTRGLFLSLNVKIAMSIVSVVLAIIVVPLIKSCYRDWKHLRDTNGVLVFLKKTWPVKIMMLCIEVIRKLPVFLQVVGSIGLVIFISFNMATVFLGFYTESQMNRYITLIVGGFLLLSFALMMWRRELRINQLKGELNKVLAAYSDKVDESHTTVDMLLDMDELKAVITQVTANTKQSEALKTELLTNVSHDLRTPLTSIISYGDLLTKETLTEEERVEYTEIINRNAYRMKKLINDLFDVTKLNNGEIRLEKQEVNMGQLLEQSVAEYEDELVKSELKLIMTKPSSPCIAAVDGDKMWRVIDNLMGNVIKYSLPKTRVYLRLEENVSDIVIQIKNVSRYELNENANQLVERFTRGDEARNTEGSGLGLAIVNAIVLLHDGELKIEVDGDMFKITIQLPKE